MQSLIAAFQARDVAEIPRTGVHVLALPRGASETAFLRALQARPEVAFAELDRILPPAAVTPNDPLFPNEWHLTKIGAPTAWSATTGSGSITIAIIDTGVDSTHPDLMAKMVAGWNVYDNNADTADVYGHGTEVAGTAAAASNDGIGVASVAWGCWLMPIRVSDPTGYAYYSTIAAGLTWAADHGARVANISYVVSGSSTVTSAAQYFQSKGGVVTSSAGNYSTFDASPDNPYIMTVSATDVNDVLYSWSNTGNNVDLAAPGCVYTTTRGGGYSSACGTSFSAPIVAAVAALVLSLQPWMLPAQVVSTLEQTTDDLGPAGWDPSYGWGRINAAKALGVSPSSADTQPPAVAIGAPAAGTTVSASTTIQVSASDNVGVASVSVYVDGALFATLLASPYSCVWNTTTAANGSHTIMATARDAAGNSSSTSITVTVSNASTDITPPSITITSPAPGSSVSGNVSVLVSATDNVGVVKVELYVDGVLTGTSTTAPFTTKWNTRKAAAGAHSLQAKAYDAAGNAGASPIVTVYK
jgi:thermitase